MFFSWNVSCGCEKTARESTSQDFSSENQDITTKTRDFELVYVGEIGFWTHISLGFGRHIMTYHDIWHIHTKHDGLSRLRSQLIVISPLWLLVDKSMFVVNKTSSWRSFLGNITKWVNQHVKFGTFFIFPYIGNVIIPFDFHIFQRGRSTTNQSLPMYKWIPNG